MEKKVDRNEDKQRSVRVSKIGNKHVKQFNIKAIVCDRSYVKTQRRTLQHYTGRYDRKEKATTYVSQVIKHAKVDL